jgi:hypothetical protein
MVSIGLTESPKPPTLSSTTGAPPAVSLLDIPPDSEATLVHGVAVGELDVGCAHPAIDFPAMPLASKTGAPPTVSLALLDVWTVPWLEHVTRLLVVNTPLTTRRPFCR